MVHVRWFTEESSTRVAQFEFDYIYLFLVMLAACYCLICFSVDRYADKHRLFAKYLYGHISLSGFEWDILKASIALMFVLNVISQHYLAPNLDIDVIGNSLATVLQIMVVVCIAINNLFLSISLVIFLVYTVFFYGFSLSVDYLAEFLGIALAFACVELERQLSKGKYSFLKSYAESFSPSDMIRLGVGIQLAILAIHNNFMNPDLGIQFLLDYPFVNFVREMGFTSFKDIHFVFSAGLAELCFGVLLMCNIASRVVASCVVFFFSITSFIFGMEELVGHIPILVGLSVVALHGKTKERNGGGSRVLSKHEKENQYHALV